MDCNQAEELFEPYILGALDSPEREALNAHVDTCPDCSLRLQGDGETVAQFALAMPQLIAPPRIKERLFSRVEADFRPNALTQAKMRATGLWTAVEDGLFPKPAMAVASALVVGLIFSGIWFNIRLNDVSEKNEKLASQVKTALEKNEDLSAQLQAVTDREAQVMEMVYSQRHLTYEAIRMSAYSGTSVNMLKSTGGLADARGMMLISRSGTEALLLALNLPPLPPDKVYQVWLIKDGQRHNAGLFTVDSTGYGQTVIIPYVSIAEFEAIGITVEPAGGSVGPTGTSVLNGDL